MREDLESQGFNGVMKNDWRMSQSLKNVFGEASSNSIE
jgi:hypothetical protein